VNDHKVAAKVEDVRIKEAIIEELAVYQDASTGDGKRMATMKEDVKALIGRSPDLSDCLIMRMYFEIRNKLAPYQSEERARVHRDIIDQFERNTFRQSQNSSR
jgi:hypothetical protein